MADDRALLAQKRIVNILKKHGVAVMRTIEQKISDAGPSNQRINPHVLTTARNQLIKAEKVIRIGNSPP